MFNIDEPEHVKVSEQFSGYSCGFLKAGINWHKSEDALIEYPREQLRGIFRLIFAHVAHISDWDTILEMRFQQQCKREGNFMQT